MQRRTLFATLAIGLTGLAAGWASGLKPGVVNEAAAVEQTYGRGFFAGAPGIVTAGDGSRFIGLASSHITRELDLDSGQSDRLDDLLKAAAQALEQASADPVFDRDRIHTLTPPAQLAAFREMAQKADTLIAGLEAPLAEFHTSLDAAQQRKLAELLSRQSDRRDARGGWWRRHG